ncbi:MAG: VWA domain-containing protein [Calditrichia bacterium]
MVFPSGAPFVRIRKTFRYYLIRYWYVTRIIVFVLIVIALARPRAGTRKQTIHTEGIDIVLVMDISTSMKAMDFSPNRLVAAQNIAAEFVQGRISDRIGLVAFAKESFTQCPLTIDYNVVINSIKGLNFASPEWDGTAIGNAIATGVDRVRTSKAKNKIMILLTDGRNNAGEIDPRTAAELAKTFNVKIYTIGCGTRGMANYPVQGRIMKVQVDIDDELLKEIADITGGKYFRATDNTALRQIYKTIDSMEKSKIEIKEFINYKENFVIYVIASIVVLLISLVLENTVLRVIPD